MASQRSDFKQRLGVSCFKVANVLLVCEFLVNEPSSKCVCLWVTASFLCFLVSKFTKEHRDLYPLFVFPPQYWSVHWCVYKLTEHTCTDGTWHFSRPNLSPPKSFFLDYLTLYDHLSNFFWWSFVLCHAADIAFSISMNLIPQILNPVMLHASKNWQ